MGTCEQLSYSFLVLRGVRGAWFRELSAIALGGGGGSRFRVGLGCRVMVWAGGGGGGRGGGRVGVRSTGPGGADGGWWWKSNASSPVNPKS